MKYFNATRCNNDKTRNIMMKNTTEHYTGWAKNLAHFFVYLITHYIKY